MEKKQLGFQRPKGASKSLKSQQLCEAVYEIVQGEMRKQAGGPEVSTEKVQKGERKAGLQRWLGR